MGAECEVLLSNASTATKREKTGTDIDHRHAHSQRDPAPLELFDDAGVPSMHLHVGCRELFAIRRERPLLQHCLSDEGWVGRGCDVVLDQRQPAVRWRTKSCLALGAARLVQKVCPLRRRVSIEHWVSAQQPQRQGIILTV